VKVDAMTYSSHNLYGEYHWVSRLRENFMSGSYGEGLETGYLAPRQSFTRQLFFKWIKQNLMLKSFYGTSANAVKTQIWISMIVYLVLAIMKERFHLENNLSQLLHFLEVNLFERKSLESIFQLNDRKMAKKNNTGHIQLKLFHY
jgi:hypothetical protein